MISTTSMSPDDNEVSLPPLMGLAVLMTMSVSNTDLTTVATALLDRINANPSDAHALMDLAVISHLWFKHEVGLITQAQALKLRQLYQLPSTLPKLSLLALMCHGDLSANTPVEFLVENSDIKLKMLYLGPNLPIPEELPYHDLILVAAGESDRNKVALQLIASILPKSDKPVLNMPANILQLSRDIISTTFQSCTSISAPISMRVTRESMQQLASGKISMSALLPDIDFPVLMRPVDSHAGQGLALITDQEKVAEYLQTRPEKLFYVSQFIDYRSEDGLFRKYRIVLVDGKAFACHMAISEHWMIHYVNAGMSSNAAKRAEEAHFMENFDTDFGLRHATAFQTIQASLALDYVVIDCGETRDGKLLIFEVDSAAVVHSMDSHDIYPYKRPQIHKIFTAFRDMLLKRVQDQLVQERV